MMIAFLMMPRLQLLMMPRLQELNQGNPMKVRMTTLISSKDGDCGDVDAAAEIDDVVPADAGVPDVPDVS